ncbi:MAG: prolipoprotein diacylglyceryl transferase [Candidatus Omnitrophica bacterium]|nr:prolipoprotein diacylglyceryl transferase [Candidatus Omnitrophota bacterium]
MHPVLFKIGPITIYTYGFMVFLGIIVGLYFALKEAKKQDIDTNKIIDLFFWIIIWGFIGARIIYIFTEWHYFLKFPLRVFFAREGFVFYGGFISAFLFAIWYIKKRNLKLWETADILAPSIAIGHAIGRLGCFFYGCCYGKPTNSWIGIIFPPESPAGQSGVPLIPTQLISSAVLFVIFCVLLIKKKHKKFQGEIFWIYVFLYAVARFIIEFFRGDPRGQIWIFSTSQFIGIFMAITAILILAGFKRTRVSEGDLP